MTDSGFAASELESLAKILLHYCNFTVAIVFAIVLIVIYGLVHAFVRRDRNIIIPVVYIFHSVLALYIAISAVAALTLPINPPNVGAFERNEWKFVGAYIFTTGFFYFWYEVTRIFLHGAHKRE